MLRTVAAVLLACLLCRVYSQPSATRLFPQHLKATEVDTKCNASTDHASVVLHWEHADLGDYSVTGYKVQVYHSNGTTEEVTLPHDAREFKYDGATCNGTTVFGVSAVTLLNAGYPGETEGLFVYPAAYVNVSREAKAPVVRNLKAVALGATSIKVEWTAADGHVVKFKVCAEALNETPVTVHTKDNSATLNDLAPDTEYTLKVSKADIDGSDIDHVQTTATTGVLQPPRDVDVHATCDHKVIASWKPSEDKLSGFQLKLCDKNQQTCGNKNVSANENTANFSVSSGQEHYTVHVQSCVMNNNKWHCSKPVVKDVSAFGKDPLVRDLQARFVNDTSLNVTWGTPHVGKIHITVCPTSTSPKKCTSYTTDGDVLAYRIDDIGDDTEYEVHAKFSTLVGYTECFHDEASVNVKRPAAGGHNSASSSSACVVLMLTSLLVAVMKSC